MWDLEQDRRLWEKLLPGLTSMLGTPGGCLALAGGQAVLFDPQGVATRLAQGTSAVSADEAGLVLVDGGEVVAFDAHGSNRQLLESGAGAGVSAVARPGGSLVLGFEDGTMELHPLSRETGIRAFAFENTSSARVAHIIEGPMGTVIAGYDNGTVGLWSGQNGKRLSGMKLAGPIAHLSLQGERLGVVSELGEVEVMDLSVFGKDRCELLRAAWSEVPVVWVNGMPLERPAPAGHECVSGGPKTGR